MSRLGVLIVDDNPGMRLVLSKIIDRNDEFECVAQASSGEEAVELFSQFRPDVVFLDIELSGMSGVECARIITDIAPKTCIVFATAHEQYRKEAFELYAFDYLVKPFDIARVEETLGRISKRLDAPLMQAPITFSPRLETLMVRRRDEITFISMDDIVFVQREDRASIMYTVTGERIETTDTLTQLFARLDPTVFMRSHKSYIINLSMISAISPYGRWTYIVRFKHISQDALITADKLSELEERFETL